MGAALQERVERLERQSHGGACAVVVVPAGTDEATACAQWRAENPEARAPGLLVIVQRFGGAA